QPRGQLFGGPSLVGLNVTDGHCRAADLCGQLFAGQVERSAALPHPGAEREQLAHEPLPAGVREKQQPPSPPSSPAARAASATQSILDRVVSWVGTLFETLIVTQTDPDTRPI